MESKLSVAEQTDPTQSYGAKMRYIFDPRLQINPRANSRRRPLLSGPTIHSLHREIRYSGRRYPDIPTLLCKINVTSAFKLTPSTARMLLYAGLRVAGYLVTYLGLYVDWKRRLEIGARSLHY